MLISSYMQQDHRECDELFARAEQAAGSAEAGAAFAAMAAALEHHFNAEETTLFPDIEARTDRAGGPTQVMRNEHTQMRGLINAMGLALQADEVERYLDLSETLLVMMQQHNLKEEQILYPMADDILASAGTDLIERMRRP